MRRIREILRRIAFEWRAWRWFWNAPNMAVLVLRGVDKQSRDVIFERWLNSDPKREPKIPD